mgnify:CR=1 FL=1
MHVQAHMLVLRSTHSHLLPPLPCYLLPHRLPECPNHTAHLLNQTLHVLVQPFQMAQRRIWHVRDVPTHNLSRRSRRWASRHSRRSRRAAIASRPSRQLLLLLLLLLGVFAAGGCSGCSRRQSCQSGRRLLLLLLLLLQEAAATGSAHRSWAEGG